MTEREQRMIEAYLPHPRDPELQEGEYYVEGDYDCKIYKVHIAEIMLSLRDDETYYGVYTSGGKHIRACTALGGYRMASLYDNKQDCKDGTHSMFNGWEALRELQQKEASHG